MPGPHWTHQVRSADSDIDDCRRKLDRLLQRDDGDDGESKQVFRNANTVVEIAIKTRKDKPSSHGKNERSSKSPGKKLVKRTTVVERLTEDEASKEGVKWGRSLATGKVAPRPSKTKSARSLSESQQRRTRSVEASKDEVDLGKAFELRTARVLLREVRAMVGRKRQDPAAVEALLDDVEFVLANNSGKKVGKDHSVLEGPSDKDKDGLIADLQRAVERLTNNNNEMVALLEGRAAAEDSLARFQEENLALSKTLAANKALLTSMATELAKKEQENARLKRVISEMQDKLNSDLERYAAKRRHTPTPSPSALLPLPSLEGSVDLPDGGGASRVAGPKGDPSSTNISSTSEDSAIEDISRSNPSSKASTVPSQAGSGDKETQGTKPKAAAIISDAKTLLGQLEVNASPGKVKSAHADRCKLEEKPVRDTASKPSPPAPESAQKQSDQAKPDLNSLESNVRDFLHRMRTQPGLDVTVPELPAARSFHSVLVTTDDGGGDTTLEGAAAAGVTTRPLELGGTLSETKFRQGLEASIFFTSDDDNAAKAGSA